MAFVFMNLPTGCVQSMLAAPRTASPFHKNPYVAGFDAGVNKEFMPSMFQVDGPKIVVKERSYKPDNAHMVDMVLEKIFCNMKLVKLYYGAS